MFEQRIPDGAPGDADQVPIRPAATVILLRDTVAGLEVFMLQRVPGMIFAPDTAVFPGGAVDPADDDPIDLTGPEPSWWANAFAITAAQARAAIVAATRELFEETGVSLAGRLGERYPALHGIPASARTQLTNGVIGWPAVLDAAGLVIRADLLRPWARWITPDGMVRRYDTCFFLAAMPPGQVADAETSEAAHGFWISLKVAVASGVAATLTLMPPTVAVLRELSAYSSVAEAMQARPQSLAHTSAREENPPPRGGTLTATSALTSARLAPNPGPMTLDGTNSYVLRGPGAATAVIVDPGPLDPDHLRELADLPVELVLITHHHADHTESSAAFHALTGAPIRAWDREFCHGGEPLTDGEVIFAGGVRIEVVQTPGHTADSVCFLLPEDEAGRGSVLTGDTILGRGTTIIAHPDGSVAPYLQSLARLEALGPCRVLPAHGPVLPELAAIAGEYAAHRQLRLDQIRGAIEQLGDRTGVTTVTDLVYFDIDPSVRQAAERSVAAQLEYLRAAERS